MQVIGDPAVGATVIDIADPRAVPMTVNPLEPGPGQQVQAHADRLSGLFEGAFGPPDPVAAALRAGLRRAYAAGGWDLRTGWGPCPGRDPAVPSFRQVRLATLAAADELGYGQGMRAAVHGFLAARLDALWAGPAGHFLEGGHPVDLARLLAGNVIVTSGAAADEETASFLAGVLLLRLAGWLSHRPAPLAVVVATPGETGLGASPRCLRCYPVAGRWHAVSCAGGARVPGTNCTPRTCWPKTTARPGSGSGCRRWCWPS